MWTVLLFFGLPIALIVVWGVRYDRKQRRLGMSTSSYQSQVDTRNQLQGKASEWHGPSDPPVTGGPF